MTEQLNESEAETFVLPSGEKALVRPDYLTHAQEIDALKEFSAKVQQMSPNGRRAAIYWLADCFLGLKLWSRW